MFDEYEKLAGPKRNVSQELPPCEGKISNTQNLPCQVQILLKLTVILENLGNYTPDELEELNHKLDIISNKTIKAV